MQKRHVIHREEYAEDEDEMCLRLGYLQCVKQEGRQVSDAAREISRVFPTDRELKSIMIRLKNHQWWDTRGRQGMYGLRDRGKQYWKSQMTEEEFATLEAIVRTKEIARRTRA